MSTLCIFDIVSVLVDMQAREGKGNMNAETATTIAQCVGGLPFSGVSLPAGPATRAALRTWLIRCGMKSATVMGLAVETLRAAYSDPEHLAALTNRDLESARIAGGSAATSAYRPTRAPDVVITPTVTITDVLDETPTSEPPAPPLPAPPPVTKTIPATPDAQAALNKLAASLAEVVGLNGAKAAPLDEARVIELVKAHSAAPTIHVVEIKSPDAPAVTIDNAHCLLKDVLTWMSSGAHVALVGPAGSGKTELARQVAEALGRKFYLTGALDSPYKLVGFIDAQGRYQRTPFRDAIEHGGLFLLDEVDASSPGVLLTINAALANGHMDFPDGIMPVHQDFVCMIAANTYGRGADRQYVGRNQLDAATLDRFAFLEVDYDEDLERRLAGNDAWHKRVTKLRRAVRETKTRMVVSMRASIRGAAALKAGVHQKDVENALIWKGIDSDTRAKIEGAAK
jgi:cobaltochelatase CobS